MCFRYVHIGRSSEVNPIYETIPYAFNAYEDSEA
jgi:hypothetical protein